MHTLSIIRPSSPQSPFQPDLSLKHHGPEKDLKGFLSDANNFSVAFQILNNGPQDSAKSTLAISKNRSEVKSNRAGYSYLGEIPKKFCWSLCKEPS